MQTYVKMQYREAQEKKVLYICMYIATITINTYRLHWKYLMFSFIPVLRVQKVNLYYVYLNNRQTETMHCCEKYIFCV